MNDPIAEHERWLRDNPRALEQVMEGIAQAMAGEFVEGPEIDTDDDPDDPAQLTESQLRSAIHSAIETTGSLRQQAKLWGISPSYLSDICNGRRSVSDAVARHLGMRRRVVVAYEPIGQAATQGTEAQADGRPAPLALPAPAPCCGSSVLIDDAGTYRCPCGNRRETQGQLAWAAMRKIETVTKMEDRP